MFWVKRMQVFNNFSLALSVKTLKSVTKQPAKTVFSLHSSPLGTFCRRDLCASTTEISYWWWNISPETGGEFRVVNTSIILLYYCERFESRSHFKSRLGLIVQVNVVLNRTVVVYSPIQDNSYNTLCIIVIVLFRTTFTCTIKPNLLLKLLWYCYYF